jgi:hypothetical protein
MPIEIKELVIRAIVDGAGDKKPDAAGGPAAPVEEIVHACVEQVLEVLRRREER